MQLFKKGNRYYTYVSFGGRQYEYCIDTGAVTSTIPIGILATMLGKSRDDVIAYLNKNGYDTTKSKTMNRHSFKCYKVRLQDVNIGGEVYDNLCAVTSEEAMSSVIGMDFLLACKMYVSPDYASVFEFNKDNYHSEDLGMYKIINGGSNVSDSNNSKAVSI